MEPLTKQTDINSAVNYIFEEQVSLTGITEFGISWEDLASGKAVLPPQGTRFNIEFEGKLFGDQINGDIKGVDYLYVRGDGKFELNIQASILTDDGVMIHVQESGISQPNSNGTAKLNLNLSFSTISPKYDWLNKRQVWAVGDVDMIKGNVSLKGYSN